MSLHKKPTRTIEEVVSLLNKNLETFSRDRYPLWHKGAVSALRKLAVDGSGQLWTMRDYMTEFEKPDYNIKLALSQYSLVPAESEEEKYVSKDAVVINDKRDTEVLYLQKKVDKLTTGIKYYKATLDNVLEDKKRVIVPKQITDYTDKGSEGTLYICFQDWHNFEYVNPEYVNGISLYTADVAIARLREATRKAMHLILALRPNRVRVAFLGDILTGYIHQENGFNSKKAFETQNITEDMFISCLSNISTVADIDKIICLSGNHGRFSKKVLPKEFYSDNLDNIMYERVKRSCKSFIDEKRFKVSLSPWYFDNVGKNAVMFGHGDKSLGSISNIQKIQASLIKVIEGVRRNEISANELTDDTKEKINFNRVLACTIGHYHKPIYDETISIPLVVMPSLMGVNEFGYHALGALNPAAQGAIYVTEDGGVESFHILNTK